MLKAKIGNIAKILGRLCSGSALCRLYFLATLVRFLRQRTWLLKAFCVVLYMGLSLL